MNNVENDEIYFFFDCETSGYTPVQSELISIGIYITDTSYNILGEFYEECTVGTERFQTNVFGREVDLWPDQAAEIHGISFQKQKTFQKPVDLYRSLWIFLQEWKDSKIRLIYHANSDFDRQFLMYRANLHAQPLYMFLAKRTTTYEYLEDGEHQHTTREDNTMKMARAYIKNGKNTLAAMTKKQKRIDKLEDMIWKDRKTPLKPEKITAYKDEKASLEVDIELLNISSVTLEGYSLDKICRSLSIDLEHHNALSDSKALISIHKFLSESLAQV